MSTTRRARGQSTGRFPPRRQGSQPATPPGFPSGLHSKGEINGERQPGAPFGSATPRENAVAAAIAYASTMKSLKVTATFLAAALILVTGVAPVFADATDDTADDAPVTVPELEAAVGPYGTWADVPGSGRVWIPNPALVGEDFTPYVSNGDWMNGPLGWTFNSNEPWGWAAFHFGQWVFLPEQGWVWTLDEAATPEWTPAAVDWRSDAGLAAWQPTVPSGFSVDAQQYALLWTVVRLAVLQRNDFSRHLMSPRLARSLRAATPPLTGPPVAPLRTWRGYPGPRTAVAAGNNQNRRGAAGAGTVAPAANPMLWLGAGASVHAPIGLGQGAGGSQLWTGPGSSVFASPGIMTSGASLYAPPGAGHNQRGGSARRRRGPVVRAGRDFAFRSGAGGGREAAGTPATGCSPASRRSLAARNPPPARAPARLRGRARPSAGPRRAAARRIAGCSPRCAGRRA